RAQLDRTLDAAPQTLSIAHFGKSAGLASQHDVSPLGPHLTRSSDGRFWIPTKDGVTVVDPARIHGNPTAPAVIIEELSMDGKPADLVSGALSFRGRELGISYTGISMAAPEEVRFKYRMDGVDPLGQWHEAGTRRNVAYVQLPPGGYRFQVMSS